MEEILTACPECNGPGPGVLVSGFSEDGSGRICEETAMRCTDCGATNDVEDWRVKPVEPKPVAYATRKPLAIACIGNGLYVRVGQPRKGRR